MSNSLKPIVEPFTKNIEKALNKYPRVNGYLLSLFRTFANSMRFLEKGVSNLLDENSPLPLKTREIVILRITANNKCEYEWGVHVYIFKKKAGLTKNQIKNTTKSVIESSLWTDEEFNLLKVIDCLCQNGMVNEKLLNDFQTNWNQEQQLEIMALCGTYHTVSFVANIAQLSNESFAASFPKDSN